MKNCVFSFLNVLNYHFVTKKRNCYIESERRKTMNNVILVGRLAADPILEEFETNKKRTVIDLAVPRNYKNQEGIYEADFIRCILWNGIALNASKYCKIGDAIALRGRIQTRSYEDESQNKKYVTEIIAQSINFVAPKYKGETHGEDK